MMTIAAEPCALAPQPAPQLRRDEACSAVVERGIAVQSCFSTICAIEYLKCRNVAATVIERVLLSPDLRRKPHH